MKVDEGGGKEDLWLRRNRSPIRLLVLLVVKVDSMVYASDESVVPTIERALTYRKLTWIMEKIR